MWHSRFQWTLDATGCVTTPVELDSGCYPFCPGILMWLPLLSMLLPPSPRWILHRPCFYILSAPNFSLGGVCAIVGVISDWQGMWNSKYSKTLSTFRHLFPVAKLLAFKKINCTTWSAYYQMISKVLFASESLWFAHFLWLTTFSVWDLFCRGKAITKNMDMFLGSFTSQFYATNFCFKLEWKGRIHISSEQQTALT